MKPFFLAKTVTALDHDLTRKTAAVASYLTAGVVVLGRGLTGA